MSIFRILKDDTTGQFQGATGIYIQNVNPCIFFRVYL